MGVPNGTALWEVTAFPRLPGRAVGGGGLASCWADMLCVATTAQPHTQNHPGNET